MFSAKDAMKEAKKECGNWNECKTQWVRNGSLVLGGDLSNISRFQFGADPSLLAAEKQLKAGCPTCKAVRYLCIKK